MVDLIERQEAIDKIKKRLFETAFNNVGIKQNIDETLVDVAENRLENWFNELPSIQPDTTTHDSIPAETGGNDDDRTSGDCISRQQAIECLNNVSFDCSMDQEVVENELLKLPPTQPERKTGRWLPDNTDYYRTRFICSVCGESEEVPTTGFGYGTMWDYCPMCGAKMERRQNGH